MTYQAVPAMSGRPMSGVVCMVGDSIMYGVNNENLAGPREPLRTALLAAGLSLRYVGTQSFAGNAGGLAANPQCECYPLYVVTRSADQVPAGSWNSLTDLATPNVGAQKSRVTVLAGGTNDIATTVLNFTAAQTATSISGWLDAVWAQRQTQADQIILCEVLKRLDSDDSKVVTLNGLLPGVIAGKSYAANVRLALTYASVTRAVIGQGYSDAVHLLDEGSTEYGNALMPYVQAAIGAALAGS